MNLNNLRVSTRLGGVLGALLLVIVAVVAFALWQMKIMRASTVEIATNWLPSVEVVNQMNTDTSDFRVFEMQHVLNTDNKAMAGIEKDLGAVQERFEKHRDIYVPLISSEEERKLYEAFAADWKSLRATRCLCLLLLHCWWPSAWGSGLFARYATSLAASPAMW